MKLNVDPFVVQMLREKFGPGWTIEDDRIFWSNIQGRKGLTKLCRDAKELESLCKRLSGHSSDREFMKYRSRLVGLFLGLSKLEGAARIIHRKLPHFFARFAAELSSEMLGRAVLVIEEKAPELLDSCGEIDGQASGTVTNRASP